MVISEKQMKKEVYAISEPGQRTEKKRDKGCRD
jgi:hypothetical protein